MNDTGVKRSRRPQTGELTDTPRDPVLDDLASALVEAGGGQVSAILLYGSHLQASSPDRWSAYDFVVLVEAYGPFYRALRSKGFLKRAAWVVTGLSHVLPPNLIAFDPGRSDQALAKCAVFKDSHFRRALSVHAPDHFLKGRAAQRVALVWAKAPEVQDWVRKGLAEARGDIPRWVRPYLRKGFDERTFAETMLRVSYRAEIRPEHPDRVRQVFLAQEPVLMEVARRSLATAEETGLVRREGKGYRYVDPPGPLARMGRSTYFVWSKVRATARWAKYIFTFDGWLDYIVRKLERRAGMKMELSHRERRWPLLFLWPKVFKVLRVLRRADPARPPENGKDHP